MKDDMHTEEHIKYICTFQKRKEINIRRQNIEWPQSRNRTSLLSQQQWPVYQIKIWELNFR